MVLASTTGEENRLALGRRYGPALGSGRTLYAEAGQSVAVMGPTQSGKTASLAVPAILRWTGPVVAASVKTDLLRDTLAWRSSLGTVWSFDPAGSTGRPSDRWSPLRSSWSWSGAKRAAADLTQVARAEGTSADGEFWYATAAKLIAPLLFAAARDRRDIADVVRWVDTQEMVEVLDILEEVGLDEPIQAARATWQREERQRSSVYTTAETVLEPFTVSNDQPLGSISVPSGEVDADRLLDGPNTLFVCAPAHDQRRLRGLFTALVAQVLDVAFTRSARQSAPLSPPLLLILDEAANIAPLAELDGLASTCAGHGVQLVTIWQDLAQVSARYGPRAHTVINNHRAKLFLSGIADPETLEHASTLVGEEELFVHSVTRGGDGRDSTTASPLQRKLLPPDALRRQPPNTGVLVYGSLPPVRLALRPWWSDRTLAARGRASARSTSYV